jgi:hypothetical protein
MEPRSSRREPAYANRPLRTYWRHYGEELPAYRSSGCRRRGKLD